MRNLWKNASNSASESSKVTWNNSLSLERCMSSNKLWKIYRRAPKRWSYALTILTRSSYLRSISRKRVWPASCTSHWWVLTVYSDLIYTVARPYSCCILAKSGQSKSARTLIWTLFRTLYFLTRLALRRAIWSICSRSAPCHSRSTWMSTGWSQTTHMSRNFTKDKAGQGRSRTWFSVRKICGIWHRTMNNSLIQNLIFHCSSVLQKSALAMSTSPRCQFMSSMFFSNYHQSKSCSIKTRERMTRS